MSKHYASAPPPKKSRLLIPMAATFIGGIVVAVTIFGPGRQAPPPAETPGSNETEQVASAEGAETPAVETPDSDGVADSSAASGEDAAADADADAAGDASDPDAGASAGADVDGEPAEPSVSVDTTAFVAVAPEGGDLNAGFAGSLDPSVASMEIDFDLNGAGIERIAFADIWETARARRAASQHRADPSAEEPDESMRYVLAASRLLEERDALVPELAANQVVIDGVAIPLIRPKSELDAGAVPLWARTGPGRFETIIQDAAGTDVLRITRTFELDESDPWTIHLEQAITNLTDQAFRVQWWQFGPGDLRVDRARYMDRRRYRFGVAVPATEGGKLVLAPTSGGGLIEHATLEKKRDDNILWPGRVAEKDPNRELSWFAVTNRYFGFAVHPPLDQTGAGPLTLDDRISDIRFSRSFDPANPKKVDDIFVYLGSPEMDLAPRGEVRVDLGIFAGPLDRGGLRSARYEPLGLDRLILYQMSAFCAICTFQWLAHLLLGFLTFLDTSVVFDWGMSIVLLVLTVRLILHPITKKSQAGMQRFGKAMSNMKPEMEKLQKKYRDDPKKMQAAQIQLMREHGVNPLQALGCLPMFLQTPIWIALYAMLYFAFDLRQAPAFYGVFQQLTGGSWSFLADLSSGDHFFGEFEEPFRFLFWNITGINLLPLLLGAVFFFQQKYLTPPPSPTMTQEQITQQKIIRFMMVVMFPVMLYSAPSGLVLYMLASSSIGIVESRHIRKHVEAEDAKREAAGLGPGGPNKRKQVQNQAAGKKPKDAQARAYQDAVDARKKKAREKAANAKKFKRRK